MPTQNDADIRCEKKLAKQIATQCAAFNEQPIT